jgi:hypothetical protein
MNYRSSNIQERLEMGFHRFQEFVACSESFSSADFHYLRSHYKVEVRDLLYSENEIHFIYKRLLEKYLNRKYFVRKIWWEKEMIIFLWILVRF